MPGEWGTRTLRPDAVLLQLPTTRSTRIACRLRTTSSAGTDGQLLLPTIAGIARRVGERKRALKRCCFRLRISVALIGTTRGPVPLCELRWATG